MKIRRIRIVLPARLRHEALATARLAAMQLATNLAGQQQPERHMALRIAGNGQPAPMLARSIGDASSRRR